MSAPAIHRVVVEGLARLPQFCHCTVADGWIHVSGTLGTKPGELALVEGGMARQTTQTMTNIGHILEAVGATFDDLVKVSVFVDDMAHFGEMNAAYEAFFDGVTPPARITVGRAGLALGAAVEIEAIAYKPGAAPRSDRGAS
ncbi:MAG: RidA family protein [Acidimicrobiales bacterium]